jgi:hypothetical protein
VDHFCHWCGFFALATPGGCLTEAGGSFEFGGARGQILCLFDQPPLAFLLQQPLSFQRQQLHLLLALAAGFFLAALTIGHVLGHRVEVDKLAVATAAGVAEMAGFTGGEPFCLDLSSLL